MIGRRVSDESGAAAPLAPECGAAIEAARAKTGRTMHTPDDLLLLAAAAIARTYTFEEKDYLAPSSRQNPEI